jgi:hypothetical protein
MLRQLTVVELVGFLVFFCLLGWVMYRDQMSATTVFKIVFLCGVMSSLKEKKNKVMTYSSLFITCVAV